MKQDREGRVGFHAGLESGPTLKSPHLFTVWFSSDFQPHSETWSPFKGDVIDCTCLLGYETKPTIHTLLLHRSCSTCTPHMKETRNTTAQRHLVDTSRMHNHALPRDVTVPHCSPPPETDSIPGAVYLDLYVDRLLILLV